MKARKKKFLGVGWRFPIQVDRRGNIATAAFEDNIKQSIRIILGTALGERPMNPLFGTRVHDYVFYPNNATTASYVSAFAQQALIKWEPRIEDIQTNAYPNPHDPNILNIEITYRVIADNTFDNLVYPFYLRREQDI